MENPLQRKLNKRSKQKIKKPVKVVYISNPMKVKICASQFRSLVQELTGQYAEFPDPTKFAAADDVGSNQTVPDGALLKDDHGAVVPTAPEAVQEKAAERDVDGSLGDDFSAQLLENFAPSFYHEPAAYIDIAKDW